MATFFNQATLSYNGNTTTSNIAAGELIEVLSATKTALNSTYFSGEEVTYVINIMNSGDAAYTNLTLTDDLGAYECDVNTVVPLTYIADSVRYFSDGVLQPAPVVSAGPPLVITGITVPANGVVTVIYKASVNQFAPLAIGDSITNTAVITGNGICEDITVSETVTTSPEARLTISKSVCPAVITECGRVTYTFVIQNTGNTAADVSYNSIISDLFDPLLSDITVSFNNTPWRAGVNYTYNTVSGQFETIPGQVTVPAATFTSDVESCAVTVEPGVSTLSVTGTIGCCR